MKALPFAVVGVMTVSSVYSQDISAIQSDDMESPLVGQQVTTSGVITLWSGRGFFMQSIEPDDNATTSDGLYVFLSRDQVQEYRDDLTAGSVVEVTGNVEEFKPFAQLPIPEWRVSVTPGTTDITAVRDRSRDGFQPITELIEVTDLSKIGERSLPEPIEFDPPGSSGIQNFADRPNVPMNVLEHPRDYLEAHEGMRMVIKDAVSVGLKRTNWTTFSVVSRAHLTDDELSAGLLPYHYNDHIFPEIVGVKSAFRQPRFDISPGTPLGDLIGVLTYQNGQYILQLETQLERSDLTAPTQDIVPSVDEDYLTVATFNVRNLDPKVEQHERPANLTEEQFRGFRKSDDVGDGRFRKIGRLIAVNLRSPDVIALQEVQDNDGTEVSLEVSASKTVETLIDAIGAAGGAEYKAVAPDPEIAHADGGQPGGNIRNVFLIRQDLGFEVLESGRLFSSNQQSAFSGSRKPVFVMLEANGRTITLVNVHLKSKLGDEGLYSASEDPQPLSNQIRLDQATELVEELESNSSRFGGKLIVLGDFNDIDGSAALAPLFDMPSSLQRVRDPRGPGYEVSHEFGGVRSAIDFILIQEGDMIDVVDARYVAGNVDALDAVSDHNPVWAAINW